MNIVEYDVMNFVTSEGEREMHYLKDESGKVYTISMGDDSKIQDINDDNNVTCEPYSGDEFDGTAEVITDLAEVEKVFDKMLDLENYWFADFSDDLVLIVVTPK